MATEDVPGFFFTNSMFLLVEAFTWYRNKMVHEVWARLFPRVAYIKLRDFSLSFPYTLGLSDLDLSLQEFHRCKRFALVC